MTVKFLEYLINTTNSRFQSPSSQVLFFYLIESLNFALLEPKILRWNKILTDVLPIISFPLTHPLDATNPFFQHKNWICFLSAIIKSNIDLCILPVASNTTACHASPFERVTPSFIKTYHSTMWNCSPPIPVFAPAWSYHPPSPW